MEEVKNSNKKRARDDQTESELDLPEVKRLKDDLLSGFEDYSDDTVPGSCDLDSVMKSFEEEITPASSSSPSPVVFVDLTSDSGESQPDLGYLLEASDDELGLPPVAEKSEGEVTELIRVDSGDSSAVGGFWGFDDQIPPTSYDSFELGIGDSNSYGEFVVYDGLFEYNDVLSDVSWRYGTLQ